MRLTQETLIESRRHGGYEIMITEGHFADENPNRENMEGIRAWRGKVCFGGVMHRTDWKRTRNEADYAVMAIVDNEAPNRLEQGGLFDGIEIESTNAVAMGA